MVLSEEVHLHPIAGFGGDEGRRIGETVFADVDNMSDWDGGDIAGNNTGGRIDWRSGDAESSNKGDKCSGKVHFDI